MKSWHVEEQFVIVSSFVCGLDRVAVWLCGCVAVWLCGCVAVWLCGCVAVWLCGCVCLRVIDVSIFFLGHLNGR